MLGLAPRLRRAVAILLEGGGLDANMRRAGLAAAVYVVAYTARCEHALVVSGTRRLVTEARPAPPRFASEFLT
jgi:hypothetical protein